jgi:hypothetical protein
LPSKNSIRFLPRPAPTFPPEEEEEEEDEEEKNN